MKTFILTTSGIDRPEAASSFSSLPSTFAVCPAEVLQAAGAQEVWKGPIEDSTVGFHPLGTCRLGNDPKTSVVDRYHRSHDVGNLFICDGSSFVTGGRGQPTMTIQSLAFRAGDHIAKFAIRSEI
jgi:choline dehydrogenase-like flavoprotein